jgi:hypothetical protein
MAAVLLALALVSSGCQKRVVHPNAINNFDGSAYDALTAAQGALDEAKAQFAAGRLPRVPSRLSIPPVKATTLPVARG